MIPKEEEIHIYLYPVRIHIETKEDARFLSPALLLSLLSINIETFISSLSLPLFLFWLALMSTFHLFLLGIEFLSGSRGCKVFVPKYLHNYMIRRGRLTNLPRQGGRERKREMVIISVSSFQG